MPPLPAFDVYGSARRGVSVHMTQHCACETWPVAGAISTVSSAVVAAGLSPLSAPASAVPQVAPDPESSIALVERLQQGDADAMDRLFARYLRPLKRWAHNRLPPYARSLSDTGPAAVPCMTLNRANVVRLPRTRLRAVAIDSWQASRSLVDLRSGSTWRNYLTN